MNLILKKILVGTAIGAWTLMPCASSAAELKLQVKTPWVRLAPPNAPTTAGYLVLHNPTAQPINVVAVESALAESTQLHAHVLERGMMAMREVEKIEVPAGGEVTFAPGSYHIMFIGMKTPLKEHDKVAFTLILADGQKILVHAPVQFMPKSAIKAHEKQSP